MLDREPPGTATPRDKVFRAFMWFTVVFIVAYVIVGVTLGVMTGTGTGFGDTRVVPVAPPGQVEGFLANLWRVVVSLAALGLLPVLWHWFLDRVGAFGGPPPSVLPSEQEQLASLAATHAQHPQAHHLADVFSKFCVGVLLVFGNFFMMYVVLRWGWGFNQ